jgi:hypothetical protein
MILLYGISPALVKIGNEERRRSPPFSGGTAARALNSPCSPWPEQIALAQGLNPIHFINKESGQQENTSCRKEVSDVTADRNASRGLGVTSLKRG